MRILPARAGPAAPLAHSRPWARDSPLLPPPPPVSEGAWAPRPACGARPASTRSSTSTFWLQGSAHEAPGCSFSPPAPWACYLCSRDAPFPQPRAAKPRPRCDLPGGSSTACSPCLSLTRHAFCIPSFNASILVISLSPPRHCATVEVLSLGYDQDAASLPLNHTHIHFQGDKGDSALPWLLKGGTGAKGAENDCP